MSAPIVGLDANSFTRLMIAAFAAVIAARLRSLPVAVVVGLGMGVAGSVVQYYLPPSSSLTQAVIPSIPFVVTAGFLLYNVVRRGAVDEGGRVGGTLDHAIVPHGHVPAGTQPLAGIGWQGPSATVVLVALLPLVLSSFWVSQLATGVVYGDHLPLVHAGDRRGRDDLALPGDLRRASARSPRRSSRRSTAGRSASRSSAAGVVAMAMGVLIGLLSIRLGDLYLALVTLTFGLLMENLVFTRDTFAKFGSGVNIARPDFATR